MGKPVERQNHSFSFFILASLIALCTAWAFYEEFLGRRPWRDFQKRAFKYEQSKAAEDLSFFTRQLDSGQIQVAINPSKPSDKITVAEAQKRLKELDQKLAKERNELEQLQAELKESEIAASDADLKVKLLKSEDDGLFYKFQNAQHEEALEDARAAKLAAEGKQGGDAETARSRAQAYHKEVAALEHERKLKADEIHKADVAAESAAAALPKAQDRP